MPIDISKATFMCDCDSTMARKIFTSILVDSTFHSEVAAHVKNDRTRKITLNRQ